MCLLFISSHKFPNMSMSKVCHDRIIALYYIMTHSRFDVGAVIFDNINDRFKEKKNKSCSTLPSL